MTAIPDPVVIAGMPDAEYHALLALSSTGVRKLLAPSTPAHYRWWADHGQAHTAAFDLGHAVHTEILGTGATIATPTGPDGVPYAEWRTKDARDQVAAIRAAGQTPVKADVRDQVWAMAAAVRAHPTAGPLLDQARVEDAQAELTVLWTDPATGVACRCRFDLITRLGDGRLVGVDVKSTEDASTTGFAKAVARYRYDQQAAWYLAGGAAADPGADIEFVFVAVEKAPPYGISLHQLNPEALAAAHDRNQRALSVFAECTASGVWPGYDAEIQTLDLPKWVAA